MKFTLTVARSVGWLEELRTRIRTWHVMHSVRVLQRYSHMLLLIPQITREGRISSTQVIRCNVNEDNAEYMLFQAADEAAAQADVVSEAYDIITDYDEDEDQ